MAFPNGWTGYEEFTLAPPASTLNGFLYIFPYDRLSETFAGFTESDGRDIRFTDASNNVLVHDSLWFSHGGTSLSGCAFFWSATDLTTVRVWTGNSAATAHANPTAAYPTTLRGFWPLATNDANGLLDRTSYNNDLSADVATTLAGVNGILPGTKATALDGSTQAFTATASVPVYAPLTMIGYANADNATVNHSLMGVSDTATADHYHTIQLSGTDASDRIQQVISSGGTAIGVASIGGFSAGVWCQAAGYTASATSRFTAINGVYGTEATANRAPSSLDTIALGKRVTSAGSINYFDGNLYLPQLWTIALPQAWIAYQYLAIIDPVTLWGGGTWIATIPNRMKFQQQQIRIPSIS